MSFSNFIIMLIFGIKIKAKNKKNNQFIENTSLKIVFCDYKNSSKSSFNWKHFIKLNIKHVITFSFNIF